MRTKSAVTVLLGLTAACADWGQYDRVMITPLDSVVGPWGMRPGVQVVSNMRFLGSSMWDTSTVGGGARGRLKLELDTVAVKTVAARRLGDTLEAVVTELPDGLVGRSGITFLAVSADAVVMRLGVDEITRVRVHADEFRFDWAGLGEALGGVFEFVALLFGEAANNSLRR